MVLDLSSLFEACLEQRNMETTKMAAGSPRQEKPLMTELAVRGFVVAPGLHIQKLPVAINSQVWDSKHPPLLLEKAIPVLWLQEDFQLVLMVAEGHTGNCTKSHRSKVEGSCIEMAVYMQRPGQAEWCNESQRSMYYKTYEGRCKYRMFHDVSRCEERERCQVFCCVTCWRTEEKQIAIVHGLQHASNKP
jgi:hypothetical protein